MNPFEPATGQVPPPRPSRINPTGAGLDIPPYPGIGRPLPVPPPKAPTTRQIANRNFGLGLLIGMLLTAAVCGWFLALTDEASGAPYGGLPQCTDQIADAGGMCHGEPLPACPTEDSTGCYWDAETMGNRQGHDVVTP